MKFNEFSESIQKEIKDTLKAYDEVNVIFEYGKYNVSTGIALKKVYAPDHKFIGTYKANEVFTSEERIINYTECFHSYPIEYKGKKDWEMINLMKDLRKELKQAVLKMVDGNLVIDRIENINL